MEVIVIILAFIGLGAVCKALGPAPAWLRFLGRVVGWTWVALMALLMAWSVGFGTWAIVAHLFSGRMTPAEWVQFAVSLPLLGFLGYVAWCVRRSPAQPAA